MDDFVKNLLTSWKLEKFIDRFEKAGVDEEVFGQIDIESLSKLFENSECGFRKRFEIRMQEWKNGICPSTSSPLVNCNIKYSPRPSPPPPTSPEFVNCEVKYSPPPCTSSQSVNLSTETRKPIAELLASTTRGKMILGAYRLNQQLNTHLLSDLVIEYEFECSGNYRINKERLTELAIEISKIFKPDYSDEMIKEYSKLFYSPFRKGTKDRKCISTSGVLYDKYLNYRRKLKRLHVISKEDEEKEDGHCS